MRKRSAPRPSGGGTREHSVGRRNACDGSYRFAAALCLAALLLVLPPLIGCGPRADPADAEPPEPISQDAVRLQIGGLEAYQQTLADLRGKVVLVDFWATWCAPCVEQFPHTIELHRKYRNRGLVVLSVSLNAPEEEPEVRGFLASHGAAFDNLLSNYPSGVEATQAFKLPGPIPYYRVYDRSGELHREFAVDPRAKRQFTPADIEAAITELL